MTGVQTCALPILTKSEPLFVLTVTSPVEVKSPTPVISFESKDTPAPEVVITGVATEVATATVPVKFALDEMVWPFMSPLVMVPAPTLNDAPCIAPDEVTDPAFHVVVPVTVPPDIATPLAS